MTTPHYTRDGALWLFALIGVACFVVSAPATFDLVSLFHNDGGWYGLAATVVLLLVLEAGAVAAKVATLFVSSGKLALSGFCVAALSVNAVSNLLHGAALAAQHGVSGWTLWIGAVVYALSVPVLLYLMLALFVRRVQQLRGDAQDVQQQVAQMMQPVQQTAAQYAALMQLVQTMQPLALLAPQQQYPRPEAVTQPHYVDDTPDDTLTQAETVPNETPVPNETKERRIRELMGQHGKSRSTIHRWIETGKVTL